MKDEQVIIIYITDTKTNTVQFWFADDQLTQTTAVTQSTIEEMQVPSHIKRVILFISTKDLLITTAHLPQVTSRLQSQAALYALEENIAENITDLHAVTLPDKDKSTKVFIIKKSLIEKLKTQFKPFATHSITLLPDIFLLPDNASQWQTFTYQQTAVIRCDHLQGLSVEQDNLPAILQLYQKNSTDMISVPYESVIKKIPPLPAINLFSGKYQFHESLESLRQTWKWPIILIGIWLLILSISTTTQMVYLSKKEAELNTAIMGIYKSIYPNAQTLTSPKQRISAELKRFSNTSQSPFFVILSAIGQTKANFPSVKFKTLDFQNNQINLSISANDFKAIENFSKQLQSRQLNVLQDNIKRESDKVTANLLISKEST